MIAGKISARDAVLAGKLEMIGQASIMGALTWLILYFYTRISRDCK